MSGGVGTPTGTTGTRGRIWLQRLNWLGGKLLDIAESVGEGVVSILGKHVPACIILHFLDCY